MEGFCEVVPVWQFPISVASFFDRIYNKSLQYQERTDSRDMFQDSRSSWEDASRLHTGARQCHPE